MILSIIQSLITKGGVAIINFLILIVSSKYLGVSSRGEISIFILNISLVQLVCGAYTGYSVVNFVPRFNLKRLFFHGILFTFIFTSLSNSAIVFFNKQVAGYYWMGWFVSLIVIINTFNCMLLLGKERIRVFNLLSILQPLLLLVGVIYFTLVLKRYTFEAYVWPLVFSFCIAGIVSSMLLIKEFKTNLKQPYVFKEVLSKGLVYQTALLLLMISNRLSYYLLPSSAAVGLYASAATLTESLLLMAQAIVPVLLARVANETDEVKNANLSLALSKFSCMLSVIGLLLIYLIPESVFVKLLGVGFVGIKQLMMVYSPSVMAAAAFIPLSSYFSAKGQQKVLFKAYGLGFVVTIALSFWLITIKGLIGAAMATNAAYFAIAILYYALFMKQNKVSLIRLFSIREDVGIIKGLVYSN